MFVWNNEFLKGSAVFFASLLLNTGKDEKKKTLLFITKLCKYHYLQKEEPSFFVKCNNAVKHVVLAHPRPCKKKLANLRRPVPGHSLYMFLYKYTFMYNINWYKYIWKSFTFHKCTETHRYIYIYIKHVQTHLPSRVYTHIYMYSPAQNKLPRTTNVASYFLMFNSSSLGVNHFASSSNSVTTIYISVVTNDKDSWSKSLAYKTRCIESLGLVLAPVLLLQILSFFPQCSSQTLSGPATWINQNGFLVLIPNHLRKFISILIFWLSIFPVTFTILFDFFSVFIFFNLFILVILVLAFSAALQLRGSFLQSLAERSQEQIIPNRS